MSTVGDVINRVFRDSLTSPDRAPAVSVLESQFPTTTHITVKIAPLPPGEQGLLTSGIIIEVGRELMRITSVTYQPPDDWFVQVERGYGGTTATTHVVGARVLFSPIVARQKLFEAVADAVVRLYPYLYSVGDVSVGSAGFAVLPPDAVGILNAYTADGKRAPARFVPARQGRNPEVYSTGEVVIYQARFPRPTDETDDLSAPPFGIEPQWEEIIDVTATSTMLAVMDWQKLRANTYVARAEAEVGPLTGASQIQRSLDARRQALLTEARQALNERYGIPVLQAGVTYGQ